MTARPSESFLKAPRWSVRFPSTLHVSQDVFVSTFSGVSLVRSNVIGCAGSMPSDTGSAPLGNLASRYSGIWLGSLKIGLLIFICGLWQGAHCISLETRRPRVIEALSRLVRVLWARVPGSQL